MISGNIAQLKQAKKELPPIINRALEFINTLDFSQHTDGQLEQDGVVYKTFTASTVLPAERKPETHKDFIDIQYVISGKERVEFCAIGDARPNESLAGQDNYFYSRTLLSLNSIELKSGDFVIFFPWDIHAPLCHDFECQQVRKMVVKVPLMAI